MKRRKGRTELTEWSLLQGKRQTSPTPTTREVKEEQVNSNYIPGKAEMFGLSMKLISLYELFSRPLGPLWKKQSVCCSLSCTTFLL